MKKLTLITLAAALLLSACGQDGEPSAKADPKWEETRHLYRTQIQYSGENDNAAKYLEIAGRSKQLFPLLEEHCNAFGMDAYNFQDIDGEGTPLYTENNLRYPFEIAPNGNSIRVSKNYFAFNPIETADGTPLAEQIVFADDTLNILVPEQFREQESEIRQAYLELFHFEKVEAEQAYNEEIGIPTSPDLLYMELNLNIIYVKDGQQYFTYRSDCAMQTGNWITDPIVQIYTSNIHCNYAHSMLSQWAYFYSDADSEKEAFEEIRPYVEQCGSENSLQKVTSVYRP